MAYDGWLTYGDVELFNLSRTAQLAEVLGIDTVLTDPDRVAWIEDALDGDDYDLVSSAPWYDPEYPASGEFAGIMPLSVSGLDDSTFEASTVEYITAGGSSNAGRHATLSIPVKVAVLASTARGADFGKRWLDRVLAGGGARKFCAGSTIRYFRWADAAAPQAHRNDVALTRSTNVVRKNVNHCSHTWIVTFTWTANDPFEYGDEIEQFTELGGVVTGDAVTESGDLRLAEDSCPVYDYSPLFDPLYPSLVAPPSVPTFYPQGWYLVPGAMMTRYWARTTPVEPSSLRLVPVITLTTDSPVRMVRVSVWPATSEPDDLCEPLWAGVISYLPAGLDFVIDGEQEAAYAWDGYSPRVRRTDSLLFGNSGVPVAWDSLSDPNGLLVTLDITDVDGEAPDAEVRVALSLVPKSD